LECRLGDGYTLGLAGCRLSPSNCPPPLMTVIAPAAAPAAGRWLCAQETDCRRSALDPPSGLGSRYMPGELGGALLSALRLCQTTVEP
jgi:hypothetical protein